VVRLGVHLDWLEVSVSVEDGAGCTSCAAALSAKVELDTP